MRERMLRAVSWSGWIGAGVLAALALAAGGCEQGSVGFDVERDVAEQTVPGDPVAHAAGAVLSNVPVLNPFDLNIDISAEAQANGGQVVQHVRLKSLALNVTATATPAGDTDCWDFVQELHVFIAPRDSGSSLPRVEIANGFNASCEQTFTLTPDSTVDLKSYLEAGARIDATGSGVPPADDVSFTGHVVVRASAN